MFQEIEHLEAIAIGHFKVCKDVARELVFRAVLKDADAFEVRDGFIAAGKAVNDAPGVELFQSSFDQEAVILIIIHDQDGLPLRLQAE